MENLLSLAFDNLSSPEPTKIRKGLRQIEGLLAQLCLAPPTPSSTSSPRRIRRSPDSSSDSLEPPTAAGTSTTPTPSTEPTSTPKSLPELSDDPAFREFFKLQEGFEWNVALRLVGALDRLLVTRARGANGADTTSNDAVVLSALDLIQGMMLLHPPSKALFAREQHMNLLLGLLDPANPPALHSATVLALVAALIDTPANTRAFEVLDGLFTLTSLFRSRSTTRDVKLKLVEFLYFYLMPETAGGSTTPGTTTPGAASPLPRSPAASRRRGSVDDGSGGGAKTRTTEEKQALLAKYVGNVDDFVRDMHPPAPFGGVV